LDQPYEAMNRDNGLVIAHYERGGGIKIGDTALDIQASPRERAGSG
jgi:hypothetical protein